MAPSEITRRCWLGVFGMTEMEQAAQIILEKCQRQGDWYPCYLRDFSTENEQRGFVELLYNGWLGKAYPGPEQSPEQAPGAGFSHWCYNGGFHVTPGFIERISTAKEITPQ